MAIISDEIHNMGSDYLLEALGEDVLFRKSDYIIENPLYRYRPNLSRAIEEIKTGRIHISDAEKMNDPYDSSYALDIDSFSKEQYQISFLLKCIHLLGSYAIDRAEQIWESHTHVSAEDSITVGEFADQLSGYCSISKTRILHGLYLFLGVDTRRHGFGYKIASFSESEASIPMWTYYADNHKGVCLKYDIGRLASDGYEFELKRAFVKIHYSDYRPRDQHGEYSLVVKSSQWSHEHEWRLICKTTEDFISVPCLSAVILGLKFDMQRIDEIITAIKESGKSVDLFQCISDPEKYDLKKLRIRIN